jgi:hypothetical protein
MHIRVYSCSSALRSTCYARLRNSFATEDRSVVKISPAVLEPNWIAQSVFPHILPVWYKSVMTKRFKHLNLCAPVSGGFDFIK